MKTFEKISDEEWKVHFAAMFAGESYDTAERRALGAYNAVIKRYERSSNKGGENLKK